MARNPDTPEAELRAGWADVLMAVLATIVYAGIPVALYLLLQ